MQARDEDIGEGLMSFSTKTAAALDFTDLDRFAAEGIPYARLARLQKEDPVHWHPVANESGFWLVTRHEDVVRISRDWRTFSSDPAHGGITGFTARDRQVRGKISAETIIRMDPPEHSKYRRFVSEGVMPSAVRQVADKIRRLSIDLIEGALDRPEFDFVTQIAAWIPLEAVAELGAIPDGDRRQMFEWVNTIVGPDDPEYAASPEELSQALRSIKDYCLSLYGTRSQDLGEDILSMMIKGEINGNRVAAERAVSFFQFLFSAGSETTRTALSHGVLALSEYPDQYEILRRNPEGVVVTAVEEILRWSSPVIYFLRGVTQDIELHGKQIRSGDRVMICYAAANRDESKFTNPFTFDITRKANAHLAFGGMGPHNCLGANLARLEMKIFFEELSKRVSKVTVMGKPSLLRSNLNPGIKHLPVHFERA
jgi:cholest-4-en-3-one 26-monooxygenase